jgi:hypothetical protein
MTWRSGRDPSQTWIVWSSLTRAASRRNQQNRNFAPKIREFASRLPKSAFQVRRKYQQGDRSEAVFAADMIHSGKDCP